MELKVTTDFSQTDIPFPLYKGLESSYEDNVYRFLKETLPNRGYEIKIKKTTYPNIDNALHNKGKKRCDAYILKSDNPDENLVCLLELESEKNIHKGIEQVNTYCNILQSKYDKGIYTTQDKNIINFVFDGENVIAWKYNFETKTVTNLSNFGVVDLINYKKSIIPQANPAMTKEFLDLFPVLSANDEKDTTLSQTESLNSIKNALRGHKLLQDNKAFLITILAAIYGKTDKVVFTDALDELKRKSRLKGADEDKEAQGIYSKWEEFQPKIKSSNDTENEISEQLIYNELYRAATNLYIICQNEHMDLYGFIYEELSAVINKKSEGEFYTSRNVIRPIVNCIMQKYIAISKLDTTNKATIIKSAQKLKVADIFCGSGGFLYEYLRYYKTHYCNIDSSDIDKIAHSSLYGMDKNDIMSAFLNMYLIGDGNTNLEQVTTSINWANQWAYKKIEKNKGRKKEIVAVPIVGAKEKINTAIKTELHKIIMNNVSTFNRFILLTIDMNWVCKNFHIKSPYNECENIIDLFKKYQYETIGNYDLTEFYKEHLTKYAHETDGIFHMVYDILKELSTSKEICADYNTFHDSLGNLDILMTNIPYGPCNDILLSTQHSGPLENLALRECIDILKPSTIKKGDYIIEDGIKTFIPNENGKSFRSNNDGGVATIIIPNGILESEVNKELRDYLFSRCDILSIIKLPTLTFAPYATIQTFIMTIRKKAPEQFCSKTQTGNCFFYIVDNDGKANSKNRYVTSLKTKANVQFKQNNIIYSMDVIENLHDELSMALSAYPEGYMSKLERAWLYGTDEVVEKWNQTRYTEEWTGSGWKSINDTKMKWGFFPLKEKLFSKRVEKKSSKIKSLFENLLFDNDALTDFDTEEQKLYIINSLKLSVLPTTSYIEVHRTITKNNTIKDKIITANQVKVSNLISRIIKDNLDVLAIKTKRQKTTTVYTIDLEKLNNFILTMDSIDLGKNIYDTEVFLDGIEDIEIEHITNSDGDYVYSVKFYTTETYTQHTLVPEDYLEKKQDFMSKEEIINNILRLRKMMKEE